MSTTDAETRVCPKCGIAAGDRPFCGSCGLNLTTVSQLPTRAEWEGGFAQPVRPPGRSDAEPATDPLSRALRAAKHGLIRYAFGSSGHSYGGSRGGSHESGNSSSPRADTASATADTPAPSQFVPRPRNRRKVWAIAGGVVLLAAIVAVVLAISLRGSDLDPARVQYWLSQNLVTTNTGSTTSWSCSPNGGSILTCSAQVVTDGVDDAPTAEGHPNGTDPAWILSKTGDACFSGSVDDDYGAEQDGLPDDVQGCY